MFRYKLYAIDGDEIGEATYVSMVRAGEQLHYGNGRKFRVVDAVHWDEDDNSPFTGMLRVEACE